MKRVPHLDLIADFQALAMQMATLERAPRDFGTGDLLTPTEITFVERIGDEPGLNITQLAARLRVTKGAVSQMLVKLEKKRLIDRRRAVDNQKAVFVYLTPRGQQAHAGYQQLHAHLYEQLARDLQQASAEQLTFLQRTLKRLRQHLEEAAR